MFPVDTANALPGPDWLRSRRLAAAERAAGAGLPTPEEEIWRYSRVGELDLDRFAIATSSPPDGIPSGVRPFLDTVADRAALVVTVDGHVVHCELDEGLGAKGVVFGSVAAMDDGASVVGSVVTTPGDVFAEMNDAFAAEPLALRVPAGVVVDRPVVVVHWLAGDGVASFPRLVVDAADDAEVSVLELLASDDVEAFVSPVVELHAGPAARLRYLGVQLLGQRVWQIGSQVARAERDATTVASMVALGGDYARVRADSKLVGRGASGDMLAVYFGERNQMHDFRTFQDHVAPDTTSDLLFKGAVEGHARSVYSGLIKVRPDARGTNAFQTNRNVKLSEHAWAESVPNLEIENNDVRCSHASTVGPVDEEQRFYLESRGVPPEVAERLIVVGFFDEVLERLPVRGIVAPLRQRIAAKLDRREEEVG
jgi:Fe-S cluster assembly protein SufD